MRSALYFALIQRLFDPASGLFAFAATDNLTHTINPLSPLIVENCSATFHFVGRLLGKALLDGQVCVRMQKNDQVGIYQFRSPSLFITLCIRFSIPT